MMNVIKRVLLFVLLLAPVLMSGSEKADREYMNITLADGTSRRIYNLLPGETPSSGDRPWMWVDGKPLEVKCLEMAPLHSGRIPVKQDDWTGSVPPKYIYVLPAGDREQDKDANE
jgi:hypothetical protein